VDHEQSGLLWKQVYGCLFRLGLRPVFAGFEARSDGRGTFTSRALDEQPY
jgi:hypothetical protein